MIENRAVWSGESASVGTARGGLNDPGGFLGAQESPNVPAVRLGARRGQVCQVVFSRPPIPPEPSGERLGRDDVVIEPRLTQASVSKGLHGVQCLR
jgi:hypothetical protein